jgi:hypothetical protein
MNPNTANAANAVNAATTVDPSISTFLKNVKPSTFTGNPTEDVEDWLNELDELFDLLNIQDGNRARLARTMLRGNARRWLLNQPTPDELEQPWDDFGEAIKRRFKSPNAKLFARAKLYQLKQKSSVTKYIELFENLRARIDDLSDAEAIQVFIQGLKPKLQEHFAGNPDLRSDMAKIMQVSENLDAVYNNSRYASFHQTGNQPRPSPTRETFPQPMDLSALPAQPTRQHRNSYTPQDNRPQTCFVCNQAGHRARYCPRNGQGSNRSSDAASLSETPTQQLSALHEAPIRSTDPYPYARRTNAQLAFAYNDWRNHCSPGSISRPVEISDSESDERNSDRQTPLRQETPERRKKNKSKHRPYYGRFQSVAPMRYRHGTPPANYIHNDELLEQAFDDMDYLGPDVQLPYAASSEEGSPPMYITSTINDKEVDVLIDSGAGNNYISTETATQLGLRTFQRRTPAWVVLANEEPVLSRLQVLVKLKMSPYYQPILVLQVIDMRYQVILGKGWLSDVAYSAIIDWRRNTVWINSHCIQGHTTPRHESILSVMQFKKTLKGADAGVVCVMTEPQDHETADKEDREQDPEVKQLLEEYQDVFPDELPKELPPSRSVDHKIEIVPGSKPPSRPTYKLSLSEMEELKRQLEDLVTHQFIQPSQSPYGAPVLFVKKKDGDLRMCVDYRALNKQTVRNTYPLPRIDELMDQLHGAKHFTKIDLRSGYHQIRIAEEDVHKTAFRTRYGLHEFKVLPFGLTNAPATFMQLMNEVFKEELDTCVIIYLDDILVYSPTLEQHRKDVRRILQKLRQERLFAKRSKCEFFQDEVEFLGHVLTSNGVQVDPKKVKAVQDWPNLECVNDVQSFLGLVNYYRKFIPDFAQTAVPLTKLLKKDQPFVWEHEQRDAFDKLKGALTTAPTLATFDPALPITVHTDASNYAIGAVLMQAGRPVAYESRKLTAAELNYPIHEKEQLAILYALTKWRTYLHSTKEPFTIVTDHESLKYLDSKEGLSGRQARWAEKLAEYNYEIKYKKGSLNVVPDALSRRPDHQLNPMSTVQLESGIHLRIAEVIQQDDYFGDVYRQTERRGDLGNQGFRISNGLLYLKDRLCVPNIPDVRNHLLKEAHDAPLSGHFGASKTYSKLYRYAYWPTMKSMVERYVQSCHMCKTSKNRTTKENGLLQPLETPERPWTHIAMDLVTHLPKTRKGHDAIVVFVDRFSKMARFAPCFTTSTARDVAHIFFKEVFRHHGLPTSIVSDRDPRFTSLFWINLFGAMATSLDMSTAHHQQTDGQSERTIQTLEQYLRLYTSKDQDTWDDQLTHAEFAYNSSRSNATGFTPFEATYGAQPRIGLALINESPLQGTIPTTKEFIEGHQERFLMVQDALQDTKRSMEKSYNARHMHVEFKVGDLVYLDAENIRTPTMTTGTHNKLSPRYLGPYKVIERVGNLNYKLDLPPGSQLLSTFHVSKLRKHVPRDPEEFPMETDDAPENSEPLLEADEEYFQEEYEVERIIKHKLAADGTLRYLIKWTGYPESKSTWQKATDLENAKDILNEYLATVGAPLTGGVSETPRAL